MDTHIVKLSSVQNWNTWKFQVRVHLKAKGLFDVVDKKELKPGEEDVNAYKRFMEKDCKAQDVIVSRLEEGPLSHVLTCESASEIWTKLHTVYEQKSEVSLHLLQRKFFNLTFNEGENMNSFLSRMEELVTQLGQCGEKVTDNMIMTKVLMALPPCYSHFISAWESVPTEGQTREKLTARLLVEEERMKNT